MARQRRTDVSTSLEPPRSFSDDQPAVPRAAAPSARRQEVLLDEAIEETFPASDPISPMVIT